MNPCICKGKREIVTPKVTYPCPVCAPAELRAMRERLEVVK